MASDDICPEKKRSKQVKTCYLKASRSQHNLEASCVQMYHSLHLACLCIHTPKKWYKCVGKQAVLSSFKDVEWHSGLFRVEK